MDYDEFNKITNSIQAYEWADKFGFKYQRCRIGVSIYRDANGRTLEISHDWCARYRPGTEPKKQRCVASIEFVKATS